MLMHKHMWHAVWTWRECHSQFTNSCHSQIHELLSRHLPHSSCSCTNICDMLYGHGACSYTAYTHTHTDQHRGRVMLCTCTCDMSHACARVMSLCDVQICDMTRVRHTCSHTDKCVTWVREFDCDMSSWIDCDTSSWIWRWLAYVTHGHALIFGRVTRPNAWHDARTRHESCVYMYMRHVRSWVVCVYTSMSHVLTWLMCCAWVMSHIQHMGYVCTCTRLGSCICTHMTCHTRVHLTSRSGLCEFCRFAHIHNSEFHHLFMY